VAEALMRGLRTTLALLLVLAGLLGYIYFIELKKPPAGEAEQKEKVFSVQADAIEHLEVKAASGDRTVLKKADGAWAIADPIAAKADEGEATSLVTNLASLEIQRVVDEQPGDLAQFGLATPRVEVAFGKAGSPADGRLLIGDRNATGGEIYAKTASSPRVFLVSSYLESTFDKGTFALRDKTILSFPRDKVDQLEIVTADGRLAFSKRPERWVLEGAEAVRLDQLQVEGAIGRLQNLAMKSIAAQEAADRDLTAYGLDKPAATVTIGAGSARAVLAVGADDGAGSRYARDASKRLVVTVEPAILDDLKKKADDYRPRDVFDFRSFTATRLEVTRGASTVAFERTTDKDGAATWRQVQPAKEVESSSVLAALGALSGLSVERYVDAKTRTGADAPVAVVTAAFDEGKKTERVAFGKVGDEVFAVREGEPGGAKVDAARFDEALKALDAVK